METFTGYILFIVLIVVNTMIHVMIQMYFEGHGAFSGEDTTLFSTETHFRTLSEKPAK